MPTDPMTSAARWWARLKRVFVPDDVILLPRDAGYCPRSLSHRHCVSKDPAIGDICALCGTLGVGNKPVLDGQTYRAMGHEGGK